MHDRHERLPVRAQDGDERRWRDHARLSACGPLGARHVPAGRPGEKTVALNEVRGALVKHERAVGQIVERCVVVSLSPLIEPLVVQLQVDRVGA